MTFSEAPNNFPCSKQVVWFQWAPANPREEQSAAYSLCIVSDSTQTHTKNTATIFDSSDTSATFFMWSLLYVDQLLQVFALLDCLETQDLTPER